MKILIAPLLGLLTTIPALADHRARSLRGVIEGANKIEVTINPTLKQLYGLEEEGPLFTYGNAAEIDKLIQSLAFEVGSPGFCACSGDYDITFFKGDQKLSSLSYHHGESLRWTSKHWEGDSYFTPDSGKAWRIWFQEHGEPTFQQDHERKIAQVKREAANREAFLSSLPVPARKVVEEFGPALEKYSEEHPLEQYDFDHQPVHKATRQKLIASIPDRQNLTFALAKSLGTLSLRGPDCGSWSYYDLEVELVLETADQLNAADFDKALASSEPAVLLGVARLFFFSQLSKKIPRGNAPAIAARLMEVVAIHDRGGNSTWAFQALDSFTSPEITDILERIALGHLKIPASPFNLGQSLPSPHYACLLLSKTNSPKFASCLKKVSSLTPEFPDDALALLLARANRDPTIALPDDIFESESTPICLHALEILAEKRSKQALDLIITKATKHDWADVRENAVLTAERITGKTWFQNQKNERAEWHGKDIREWWTKNKATFVIPKSDGD